MIYNKVLAGDRTGEALPVMELTQLKYFQALARHGSFSQTAKAIMVSQSALSRSIAKLEKELAVMLFERQGKQTKLTEAGEKFLFHVDRVLREMDVARQEIKMDNGGEGTVTKVGSGKLTIRPTSGGGYQYRCAGRIDGRRQSARPKYCAVRQWRSNG